MHFIICFHQMLTAPFLHHAIRLGPETPLLNKMGKVSIKSKLVLASAHEIQGPGVKLLFIITFANILETTLLKNSQLFYFKRKKKLYRQENSLIQTWGQLNKMLNIKEGMCKATHLLITFIENNRIKFNTKLKSKYRYQANTNNLTPLVLT